MAISAKKVNIWGVKSVKMLFVIVSYLPFQD